MTKTFVLISLLVCTLNSCAHSEESQQEEKEYAKPKKRQKTKVNEDLGWILDILH